MTLSTVQHTPSRTVHLATCSAVLRMRRTLLEHLTRIYPTRQKELTPPAIASLTPVDGLQLRVPVSVAGSAARALTLFLPEDFQPHLDRLADQVPRVRVQPNTSLTTQCAYISWETGHGQPPLAAWVEARVVVAALDENQQETGWSLLPLVLVAGHTVLVTEFTPDESWLIEARAALEAARQPPLGITAAQREKAAQTAEKYSERPWLFMRYELKNGTERLAVNWAPVQRMVSTR